MSKDLLYPLRRLHGLIHDYRAEENVIRQVRQRIDAAGADAVLFVLTPTHGNLGDHAIASAVTQMLGQLQMDYVEVTASELKLLEKHGKLGIMNRRPILVNGGGNIGTLWPGVEKSFRGVIRACPDSKIICLPNTAFFEDSPLGRREREKSAWIYRRHRNLKICAREKISFELLRQLHHDVVLIPDMALSLNKCVDGPWRRGCVLCLRTDLEKTRTDAQERTVREQAAQLFGEYVTDSDMNIRRSVPAHQRETALEEKYDVFRQAELVITDRLHGMIFAAITGTPCIVLDSKSPKVRGCYEWLRQLPYVRFADRAEQITRVYESMPKTLCRYDNSHLADYYRQLAETLSDMVR